MQSDHKSVQENMSANTASQQIMDGWSKKLYTVVKSYLAFVSMVSEGDKSILSIGDVERKAINEFERDIETILQDIHAMGPKVALNKVMSGMMNILLTALDSLEGDENKEQKQERVLYEFNQVNSFILLKASHQLFRTKTILPSDATIRLSLIPVAGFSHVHNVDKSFPLSDWEKREIGLSFERNGLVAPSVKVVVLSDLLSLNDVMLSFSACYDLNKKLQSAFLNEHASIEESLSSILSEHEPLIKQSNPGDIEQLGKVLGGPNQTLTAVHRYIMVAFFVNSDDDLDVLDSVGEQASIATIEDLGTYDANNGDDYLEDFKSWSLDAENMIPQTVYQPYVLPALPYADAVELSLLHENKTKIKVMCQHAKALARGAPLVFDWSMDHERSALFITIKEGVNSASSVPVEQKTIEVFNLFLPPWHLPTSAFLSWAVNEVSDHGITLQTEPSSHVMQMKMN